MLVAGLHTVRKPTQWWGWLLMGIALGFGLLAKAYFLTAVPAVIVVAAIAFWSNRDGTASARSIRAILLRLGVSLAVTLVVAGRWYANVRRTTGSWSGLSFDAAQRHISILQKLAAVPHVNWKSGALSILISHVWFGGWSFLRVPVAVYVLAFAVILLAMVGAAVRLFRRRASLKAERDVLVLMAFYVCFWAGLGYHVLVTYLSVGASSSNGWYLYSAVAAEIVLLVWGLQAFAPAHLVFPGLAVGWAALDLYGAHALLMPYYTGLTSHVGKSVPAALWATLTQLPMVFDRLAQLRPPWLNAQALLCGWVGYWIATVATVLWIVMRFRKSAIAA
jgi:4-amino-4-deoxy-L-arabinose transferase-like glycosyltransferase